MRRNAFVLGELTFMHLGVRVLFRLNFSCALLLME
jgi:hypothetical protein